MSAINFDATNVKPDTGGFIVVPKGEYTAQICGSEIKETAAKNGRLIEFNFKIVGGDFNGNVIKERINFENESAQAQSIGQAQLSAIMHGIGILKITSTEQLHGRPLKIMVDIEDYKKANKTTGIMEDRQSNRISSFSKAEGVTGAASAPPAFLGQNSTPPTAPTPPPVAQPAPVAPTPPAAPVSDGKLYYVAHKGTNITPIPISAAEVLAKGLLAAETMVCLNGGTAWEPLTSLNPSAPVATPPPWARQ